MSNQIYQPALYDMYKLEVINDMVGKMIEQNHRREIILSSVINSVGSEYKKHIIKNIEVQTNDRRIYT
jgi:hypothetical protein